MVAALALLLELAALFLGIQPPALRATRGFSRSARLRRWLQAIAQKFSQAFKSQLPVPPLRAMLSGNHPQYPSIET